MKATKSESNNLFFETQKIRKPLIAADAPISTDGEADNTFLFDIDTEKGKSYTLEYK